MVRSIAARRRYQQTQERSRLRACDSRPYFFRLSRSSRALSSALDALSEDQRDRVLVDWAACGASLDGLAVRDMAFLARAPGPQRLTHCGPLLITDVIRYVIFYLLALCIH